MQLFLQISNCTFYLEKRYFVLAESSTCFCILRIFSRAVNTAWGTVAVGLHTSIPIYSIEAVDTISTPAAKGKCE